MVVGGGGGEHEGAVVGLGGGFVVVVVVGGEVDAGAALEGGEEGRGDARAEPARPALHGSVVGGAEEGGDWLGFGHRRGGD